MSVRKILLASVCSAFLAASAAVSGAAAATTGSQLISRAYKALQIGDAAAAASAYGQAIESRQLEPEVLANALLNRGLAFQRLNEHELAIDDYTAAMRIDAMSAKLRALALYNRGLSYQRLKQNAPAAEDFTSALFLDSQFSHAYYSRGVLLRDNGQYLFALADFDKALRFHYPDLARVHFAQSLTFEKLNRKTDARDSLNNALAANPRYEPAIQRLALLDGKVAPILKVAAPSDQIVTAAVTPAITKLPEAKLPEAKPPSAALLAGDSTAAATAKPKFKKKFTDRLPDEIHTAKVEPAAAKPEAAENILTPGAPPDENASGQEDAVAEEPSSATPEVTGWSVQIASAATEAAAWSTWKKMRARHKALSAKEPVVVRADLGTKGVFYRVRLVGFDTQTDANSECAKLKRKGVRCYISKAAS